MNKKQKYLKYSTFLLILCASMLCFLFYMESFSNVSKIYKWKYSVNKENNVVQLEEGSPREEKLLHMLEEINNMEFVANNDTPLTNNSVVIVIQVKKPITLYTFLSISINNI